MTSPCFLSVVISVQTFIGIRRDFLICCQTLKIAVSRGAPSPPCIGFRREMLFLICDG